MNLELRIIINSLVGLVLGGAVVFIAVATSLVLAFFAEAGVTIPGIISVWTTSENDSTALNIDPNLVGIVTASLAIAALYAAAATRRFLRVDTPAK